MQDNNHFSIPATLLVDSAAIREVISSAFAEVMMGKETGVRVTPVTTADSQPEPEVVTPKQKKQLKLRITSNATAEEKGKQIVVQTLQQAYGIAVKWDDEDTKAITFLSTLYPDVSHHSLAATLSEMPKEELVDVPPRIFLSDAFKNASDMLAATKDKVGEEDMSRNTIPNPTPESGPPVRDRMPMPITAAQTIPYSCTTCGAPPLRHFSDCPQATTAPTGPCPHCQAPAPRHFSDCLTVEAGPAIPRGGGAIPSRVPTGRQPHPSETGGRPVDAVTPPSVVSIPGVEGDAVPCPTAGRECALPHRMALHGNIRIPVHVMEDISRILAAANASGLIPTGEVLSTSSGTFVPKEITVGPMTMPIHPTEAGPLPPREEGTTPVGSTKSALRKSKAKKQTPEGT